MGIVAISDPAGRMSQNLNGRLGDMFVVVGGTGLAKVLEHPGALLARFNAPLRWYTG
jgi:hypothetical protein